MIFAKYSATITPMMCQYKLYKIMRNIIKPYVTKNKVLIKNSIEYIDAHYMEDFRKIFKDLTSFSPTKYKNRLRIEHAKELFNKTNMSVLEIAEAVGINDQLYFSRLFKQFTGLSPSKFKNSII